MFTPIFCLQGRPTFFPRLSCNYPREPVNRSRNNHSLLEFFWQSITYIDNFSGDYSSVHYITLMLVMGETKNFFLIAANDMITAQHDAGLTAISVAAQPEAAAELKPREPKIPPFFWGGSPLSKKHPQDNFGLQNVNWHPPKRDWWPPIRSFASLLDLHFGGCQFAF